MEFSQAVLDCKRRDLHGVDNFCWDMPSLGERIFFLGLGRILGVGTVYITSFENFVAVLFGVGVVGFNFCRPRCVSIPCHVGIHDVRCRFWWSLYSWFWCEVQLRRKFQHPWF